MCWCSVRWQTANCPFGETEKYSRPASHPSAGKRPVARYVRLASRYGVLLRIGAPRALRSRIAS